MNKLIIGGVLVTMMGGTPTATYFLTKEASTTTEPEKAVPGVQGSNGGTGESTTCSSTNTGDGCPKAPAPVEKQ